MTMVLVPIDGSATALRALRHAMKSADTIHIVNVQLPARFPDLLLDLSKTDLHRWLREQGRLKTVEACKLLDRNGCNYHVHVMIGEPAEKIVRLAKAQGVDAIVMGTRGMGALGSLMLGSTAMKVIHLAEVPVTLVR